MTYCMDMLCYKKSILLVHGQKRVSLGVEERNPCAATLSRMMAPMWWWELEHWIWMTRYGVGVTSFLTMELLPNGQSPTRVISESLRTQSQPRSTSGKARTRSLWWSCKTLPFGHGGLKRQIGLKLSFLHLQADMCLRFLSAMLSVVTISS